MSRALVSLEGSPPLYTTTIDYFRGVDVTSAPINVAMGRAFNAPNMIRDVPGKVRKRMGYRKVQTFSGRVNGMHSFDGHKVWHIGTALYFDGTRVKNKSGGTVNLPDARSTAYRLADKLTILTGDGIFTFWMEGSSYYVDDAQNLGTVPQVTVGRAPNGIGGNSLQQINMLTNKYMDSFLGTAGTTQYQLSFYPINSAVKAEKIDANGTWTDITSTISSVNTNTGVVTFSTAPGAPPVSGEDNVRITAIAPSIKQYTKLRKCRFGIVAGVRSAYDRLFISGNPDLPNTDFFSMSDDPLYFGDWNYGEIGKQGSAITGYSIVEGNLATHKENDDNDRNCYIRSGEINEDYETDIVDLMTVKFPVSQTIQGKGCIAPYSLEYLTEPLYLTAEGIYATTPYEFNARLYAQKRSFYLDGRLLNEPNLQNAVSCVWKDFYLLAINGTVYILDVLQRDSSDVARGSQYQYEGYIWTGIPVRCWYVDEHLWFGDDAGNIYQFYEDKYSSESYEDNGEPIIAHWEFMHIGSNFYLDKTLMWFALNLDHTPSASIDLYAKRSTDSNWQSLALNANLSFFSYASLVYSQMAYGGSDQPKTVGKKVRVKRYDSATFSLRNEKPGEGIFLYAITLQYAEGEKYKL